MTLIRRIGYFLVALVLLVALVVWSLPVTLPLALRLAGVGDVRWSSIDIGLLQARIEALEIGEPPSQQVSSIDVDYSLQSLWRGRLERLRIDGLIVEASYRDGVLSIGGEIVGGGKADAVGETSDPAVPLFAETLVIENSRIELKTPLGPLSLPFGGKVMHVGERLQFDLDIAEAALDIERSGRVEGTLKLSGHLPAGGAPPADQVSASGRVDLASAGLLVGEGTEPIAASAGLDIALADGRVTVTGPIGLSGDGLASDGELSSSFTFDKRWRPASVDIADLSIEVTKLDRHGLKVDQARLTLNARGAPDDLAGRLSLDVEGLTADLGDVEVRGVKGGRVLDFAVREDALEIAAREPGKKLSIDGVTLRRDGEEMLATGWFTLPWPEREEPWFRYRVDNGAFDVDLDLVIDPARIDAGANRFWARIEDLTARLSGNANGLAEGLIRVRKGRADFPSVNLALTGIESDVVIDDQGLAAGAPVPLTIRSLRPLDEPRLFRPLQLDVMLKPSADRLDVEGSLKLAAKPATVLTIKGGHDVEAEVGTLDLSLPPLVFAAGQVQPADFSPLLEGVLTETVGEIALDGQLTWEDGELESDLSLLIRELGFAIGPARLSRINSVIRFDSLTPPSTPAAQLLSVGLLDVGLPLTDGLVSMQLRPDGQLSVDQLTWRLADGEIRAAPFTFGSDVKGLTMVLTAEQLDLEALLRLTPLDELTGEGRIDGTLPLTIGETAALDGGELAASSPGVIRYAPSAVPGILQAGGESVNLMLQALENFQYDALNLTLDGKTDGDTKIGLHLKGANPELYDGYPVEFNLNLDGNLASLIQTNLDNYQIPDRIRERLQGFQQ